MSQLYLAYSPIATRKLGRMAWLDRYGITNNVVIGPHAEPKLHLPGVGGISDFSAYESHAVFGVRDERWGVAVCAVAVSKHDQTLDEAGLRSYLEARLTKYKVPKIILFRATPIPKSAVGKPLRRKVRDEHLAELEFARSTRR